MDWKRRTLRGATRLGVAPPLIDIYTRLQGQETISPVFDVTPEIQEYTLAKEDVHGNVLLPLTQGRDAVVSYSYCILAHAFRTRGYRPLVPLCTADLDLCIQKEHQPDDRATCALCHHYGSDLVAAFGLDPIPMDGIGRSRATSVESAVERGYRGVDVAELAKATTRRFLKKRLIDYDDGYESSVYRRFVRTAMDLVDFANDLFDRYDIRATVAHHPTYVYGGAYLAVAEQRGVPAVTVQPGYNDRTLLFGKYRNRSGLPQFTDREWLKPVLSEPLNEVQADAIDRLMQARVDGEGIRIHPAAEADTAINCDDAATSIGVFTNLMWDASLEAETVTFTSAYNWVSTTIEHLRHHEDTELVVKAHPAEDILQTEIGMANWLRANYDPLPENVTVLDPDTDVSPYQLMREIDLGVVFNSTLGLEMSYFGVPVVVLSDTHYRGLGFTYDVETVAEYLDLLDRAEELQVSDEMQALARRYAHLLFVQKQIDFPFYTQSGRDIELLPVEHDAVADSEVFDRVVEAVLTDNVVLTPGLDVLD